MKICIDGRPILAQMHGIGRYALNLIRQLSRIDQTNEYFILLRPEGRELFRTLPQNFHILDCHIPIYSAWEQAIIPRLLRKMSIDLFHSTTYTAPLFAKCRMVITIHDLIPMIFPQDYSLAHAMYYRHLVRRVLLKAERIVTVSHSSRNDLARIFGLDGKNIVVTYHGVDERFIPDPDGISKKRVADEFSIKEPFILSVVNEKPHKNVSGLMKAYAKLLNKEPMPRLVTVGIKEIEGLKDLIRAISNRSIFLSDVSDEQLIVLLQSAELFVLPSLYEGFGLPVLEAMACGTPVITSTIASLSEITDGAAVLINPQNVDDLAEAIYNVLGKKELQAELREKGLEQAKKFSWQKTAVQTLKVYEEVAARSD